MAVFKETQLNKGLRGVFDNAATDQPQALWFRIDGSVDRTIYEIHAGYISNFFALPAPVTDIAEEYIRGRVVVWMGEYDISTLPISDLLLMFSPFGLTNRVPGQILFDRVFSNNLDISFTNPLAIPSGQIVNVTMCPGYRVTDAGVLTFTNTVGSLSVGGNYEGIKQFPFSLR